MADGDERTRTRRPAPPSTDPRDETGSTARAATRPVSAGRARAARTARPPDDPLARLQALHPTTGTPAGPLVMSPGASPSPTTGPHLPPPAPRVEPAPVDPRADETRLGLRDRARARAHRRGATSEVPTTDPVTEHVERSEPPDSDRAEPDVPDGAEGHTGTEDRVDEPFRVLGGLRLTNDDDIDVEAGVAADRTGRDHRDPGDADGRDHTPSFGSRPAVASGLVLPVEPVAPTPRLLLPTGRIPRIGHTRPSPVSDLPLTGIEPSVREESPGTVVVPELDPSGDIARDGLVVERRSLRDRLEPIFIRRPRPRVRRVTRVVRHLDTWSVFKVALVFNLVVYVVCLTAGVLLWNIAYTTGTIDNVEQFFEQFGWEHFEFHGGEIYHHAWIAGLFAIVGLTGFAVLLATLFNLITDLVGGIRVSVLEEEVIERVPHRRRTRVSRTRPRADVRDAAPGGAGSDRPIDRATGDVPVIRPDL